MHLWTRIDVICQLVTPISLQIQILCQVVSFDAMVSCQPRLGKLHCGSTFCTAHCACCSRSDSLLHDHIWKRALSGCFACFPCRRSGVGDSKSEGLGA